MNLILFLVAFCVGIAMSVQAAVNSQLASSIGANSVAAALVSFSCGTVALLAIALAKGGLIVLVIAGQLITSMAIDHFGLIHMAVRKVSAVRLAGALVVALGVAITLFGDRIVASMGR